MINEWIKHISEQNNLVDTLVIQSNDFYSLNSKMKDIKNREMFIIPPANINKIAMNLSKLADRVPDVMKGLNVLNKTEAGAFFWEDEQNIAEFTIALIESNILARNIIKDLGQEVAMQIQFYFVVQIFKKYLDVKSRTALEKYANIFITIMFGELKERQYKISNTILEKNCKNFIFNMYK